MPGSTTSWLVTGQVIASLSLSLLICIMGSTTLPASPCEDAAGCQCKAVGTEGEVSGLESLWKPGMGLSRNAAQKLHILTKDRAAQAEELRAFLPCRGPGARCERPCQHLRHWLWSLGHDLNPDSATRWL